MMKSRQGVGVAEFRHVERQTSRIADQLVQRLQAAGVTKVFGIPGGSIAPLYDALIESDIEVVVAQHESMAVYSAYGYSRATGKASVVLVTSGPGILNAATALAAAKLDEAGVVLICGDVGAELKGRGGLQDGGLGGLDIAHVLAPLAKRVEHVAHAGRAVACLDQALVDCMAHPRGPVVLNLGVDVAMGTVAHTVARAQAATLQAASRGLCERIAEQLASAARPAIWLGIGARNAEVGALVLRLAERTRCPVITDIEAKGLVPESHALSLGLVGVGSKGFAEGYLAGGVDFLLTVGARLDDTTTSGFSDLVQAQGCMIQLDHDPARINRSYVFDESVVCDLEGTLTEVANRVPRVSAHLVLARDGAMQEVRRSHFAHPVGDLSSGPHHPAAVLAALQEVFPRDTVFTTDIGNHLIFAAQGLKIEQPGRFHVSNGLGGMGSGIGTAVGLALGHKGRRAVVGVCGDGSLRMVGNELATCAMHGIPVVLAVLNDGQLGMVEHGNQRVFGRSGSCASPDVDVVAYATALGAKAVRIDSKKDLIKAMSWVGTGPLVLEFPVRAEVRAANPRADVFAFPGAAK